MDTKQFYYLKRVLSDVEQNEFIALKKDEVVLGRKELPGEHISRSHARFKRAGDRWTVTNLSCNGTFVNGDSLANGEEYSLPIGTVIQFGQPDIYVYRFKMKLVEAESQGGSKSHQTIKKTKLDNERCGVKTNLSHEQSVLERQLRESDALQARLQEERNQLHHSLQHQQNELQQRYKLDREQLEQKFADGALAQQALLKEKEALATNLEIQVCEMQNRLEDERKNLEERLTREEEQRNHILQEKENVLLLLEKENARRTHLEEKLKATEGHKEELQQQVDAIVTSIRVKEVEQQEAERELKEQQNKLASERARLAEELETVKTTLIEKENSYALLDNELKEKDELQTKLASIEAEMKTRIAEEVKKSAALVHKETDKQLEQLAEEKSKLEEQLQIAKAQDQVQWSMIQVELQTLEAQKISLEQELATSAVSSEYAKQEVVESVANVLENEFQCPICNDLFITAVMLNCSHTFCKYCIDRWKKNKKDCPNCRVPIVSETRSLVVDNFIEKIVPTLSEDLQTKRTEIVMERKAEMEAAALAQAQAAAAAEAARRSRRGRGRGRGNRGSLRQNQAQTQSGSGSRPGPFHTTNPEPQSTQVQNPSIANEPHAIVLSSNSENSDASILSDSSSVSGDGMADYGGYGRCYNCGRRGHWAHGCLDYYWI